ncbi:MAG: hypothetical protein LBD94_01870 [Rickettsiales bacterium]|jgi:hypothetical protein|nr:hypothetical protein [Rickettsiales bacterium]
MERFNGLANLYESVKTLMSAICVEKGGLDIDNYSGRFFAADLLEFIVAYGASAGADVSALREELESKKDLITPSNKPIYEMTLAEFEKMLGGQNKE